jgi:co-chaperonin GroES (HSP10)
VPGNYTAHGKYVLLELDEVQEEKEIGAHKLIVPGGDTTEVLLRGKVLSIGTETSGEIQQGDYAYISKYSGAPFTTTQGKKRIVVAEEYILLVEEGR